MVQSVSKHERTSYTTYDGVYFRKSYVILPLFVITVLFVGWLLDDAFAQISLLPGDMTRGLSSNTGDDQSSSVITNQTSGLSTYTNAEYGSEIDFPSNWEVRPASSTFSFGIEGIPNTITYIRSPADQGIHDLVTISVQAPGRFLDTDEMVVKTSNLTPQEYAKIMTNLLPEHGFNLVREKAVTVSGFPAWRIEYTTYNYDTEVFVVKDDGTMYKIEFGTPMLKTPESLPVFDKMVESFRFLNSSEVQQTQASQNSTSGITTGEDVTNTGIIGLARLSSIEPNCGSY
ncbi:MAG: hypothetical protein ACRD5J_10395 [Nitrososphaeraceae archaeon]